jgi:two-component system, NtrC family, response regulator GlrR
MSPSPPIKPYARAQLIGDSPAFQVVLEGLANAAGVDAPVLIQGRTGTGKELVARAIHYTSHRRDGPFVPVNCGAIPDTMMESELFGHVRGAFTDARADREGLVAQADRGTLLLDEVDSLSAKGQVVLLRFLQDLQYRPLGARALRRSDTRILAASNADLALAVARGGFREDLFYRLAVLTIETPPLASRADDIAPLARHFLARIAGRYGLPEKRLSPRALRAMECHDWPGNVRELENFLHRACVMTEGDVVDLLPGGPCQQKVVEPPPNATLPRAGFHAAKADAIARFERIYLSRVLAEAGGNVTRAAGIAGTERRTFGKLLKRHDLRR